MKFILFGITWDLKPLAILIYGIVCLFAVFSPLSFDNDTPGWATVLWLAIVATLIIGHDHINQWLQKGKNENE